MALSKTKYLLLSKEIMEDYYLQLREQGSPPDGRDKYIDGFLDSGLLSELVTVKETQVVIDAANMAIFGVSIAERQKVYEDIEASHDEYIDVPTFFRKGIIALRINDEAG